MNPNIQIVCSFALTFGVPIVAAGWELWRLGPSGWDLPPNEDVPLVPPPLPDAGDPPRIQKPLPDCLVPQAVRVRVAELV